MLRFWKKQKSQFPAVQVRRGGGHPFDALRNYVPLYSRETALYRAVREAVPVVDAAIYKMIRLIGGFCVRCEDTAAEKDLNAFLRTVPVGRGQLGINAFLDAYLKDHGGEVDYIHGDEVVEQLGRKPGSIGFRLPAMGKEQLFKTVMADGVLPRKTFSMGHAQDKRYYVEARKIK